jgi:hypothetical protein
MRLRRCAYTPVRSPSCPKLDQTTGVGVDPKLRPQRSPQAVEEPGIDAEAVAVLSPALPDSRETSQGIDSDLRGSLEIVGVLVDHDFGSQRLSRKVEGPGGDGAGDRVDPVILRYHHEVARRPHGHVRMAVRAPLCVDLKLILPRIPVRVESTGIEPGDAVILGGADPDHDVVPLAVDRQGRCGLVSLQSDVDGDLVSGRLGVETRPQDQDKQRQKAFPAHVRQRQPLLSYLRGYVNLTPGNVNISKTVMVMKQSGKLKRQPGDFPQRGNSPNSSARSPLRGTMPARLRTASLSAYPTDLKIKMVLGMLPLGTKPWSIPGQIIYNGAGRRVLRSRRLPDPPEGENRCKRNLKPAFRRN